MSPVVSSHHHATMRPDHHHPAIALPGLPTTTAASTSPSVSATDQALSLPHDKIPTEAIAEALHVGSDHIVIDTFDETKDNDNTKSCEKGEGKGKEDGNESKDMGDEKGEKSGGVDSLVVLQLQSRSQSQELKQNHLNIDTTEMTTASSQSLTSKLLASGGDIRALLSSDQPLSSLWAQSADTGNGKEGAGHKIVENDEEEAEEDEQQERFVRPRRLHLKESKKAASDGFPSAIALSHRWHPDHMQDLPGDAPNLSIRAAFDTKYDEFYVFRHWRPSQGRWPPLTQLSYSPL